jgi:hypothetical protein
VNAKFAAVWPNISDKKEPPVDAEEFQGAEGKFDKFFGESSGSRKLIQCFTTRQRLADYQGAAGPATLPSNKKAGLPK